jgi:predicted DNA-binding transcriptional regulator AlpA
MNKPATPRLLQLSDMASRARVSGTWLRDEAEAGRIPCLRAGDCLLFHPPTVERILVERASGLAAGAGGAETRTAKPSEESPGPRDPQPAQEPLLVDVAGVAKLLGVAQGSIFAWRSAGKFGPAPVRMGRCVRFRVEEIRRWVDAGCPPRVKWAAIQGNDRP